MRLWLTISQATKALKAQLLETTHSSRQVSKQGKRILRMPGMVMCKETIILAQDREEAMVSPLFQATQL